MKKILFLAVMVAMILGFSMQADANLPNLVYQLIIVVRSDLIEGRLTHEECIKNIIDNPAADGIRVKRIR